MPNKQGRKKKSKKQAKVPVADLKPSKDAKGGGGGKGFHFGPPPT
jgi:hypothetical protein